MDICICMCICVYVYILTAYADGFWRAGCLDNVLGSSRGSEKVRTLSY